MDARECATLKSKQRRNLEDKPFIVKLYDNTVPISAPPD
jgi:hypothetical protein